MSIDHVVILVKDLAQAVQDYTGLGFQVVEGGEHTDGATHNALIAFEDGSYLELIAFKRAAPQHRWWPFTQIGGGEGLIDFALLPTDIEADIAAARARGVDYSGPHPGGRFRLDGIELRWQTGLPPTTDLPFLCADLTPRPLRVPDGPALVHPNGAKGIQSLVVLVSDRTASLRRYQALLGQAPASNSNSSPAGNDSALTCFELPAGSICLTDKPGVEGSPGLAEHFSQGPLALNLFTSGVAVQLELPQTNQARISLINQK